MLPQATEHMQPPDTGWTRNRFSFRASEKHAALPTPWLQKSGFQKCAIMFLWSQRVCGSLLQQPRKTSTTTVFLQGLDEDSKSFSIQCFRQQKTTYWKVKVRFKHCCLDFIHSFTINVAAKPFFSLAVLYWSNLNDADTFNSFKN